MSKKALSKGAPAKGYTVAGSFSTLDEARRGCGTINTAHWRIYRVGSVYQVFYKRKGSTVKAPSRRK
jgi:hypothetical protein